MRCNISSTMDLNWKNFFNTRWIKPKNKIKICAYTLCQFVEHLFTKYLIYSTQLEAPTLHLTKLASILSTPRAKKNLLVDEMT